MYGGSGLPNPAFITGNRNKHRHFLINVNMRRYASANLRRYGKKRKQIFLFLGKGFDVVLEAMPVSGSVVVRLNELKE
jgi:hypothetical protein